MQRRWQGEEGDEDGMQKWRLRILPQTEDPLLQGRHSPRQAALFPILARGPQGVHLQGRDHAEVRGH